MCGFAAIIGLNGTKVDSKNVERMGEVIRHRGPNAQGHFCDGTVGLAFRRLSIQDLSPAGNQPMFSADGRYVIVFNGEIYNYLELSEELKSRGYHFRSGSDTEVLLNSFIEWGWDCLNKFNGMWSFLIYDSKLGLVSGSRDRFGVKPMYVHRNRNYVLFGSEIKTIRSSGLYQTRINWSVAAQFLLQERLDDTTQSFFCDIETIPPGSAFEIDIDGNLKLWQFWSLANLTDTSATDFKQEYFDIFMDAIRLRLRSDVPLGVFLSGGMDSTSIICGMARLKLEQGGNEPLKAFSFIHEEYDESRYIEDTIQQTQADLSRLSLDVNMLWESLGRVLWFHDEPLHSFTAVIGYNLAKLAASHGIIVVLNGQGADETTAGYPSYYHNYWYSLLSHGEARLAWREIQEFTRENGGQPATHRFGRLLKEKVQTQFHRIAWYRLLAAWKKRLAAQRNPWFDSDFKQHLDREETEYRDLDLDSVLTKSVERSPLPLYLRIEDRNSMAHGVEVRLPFLDYRLVSLLFSKVPANWKMRGVWNKFIMRESMKEKIPESVRTRRDKMGFPTPINTWIRESLHDSFFEILNDRRSRERGIYNNDRLLRDLERHKRGEIDIGAKLFNVVQFELWLREVVEGTEVGSR